MRKLASAAALVLVAGSLLAPAQAASSQSRKSTVHEVVMGGGPAAVLWNYGPEDLTISKGDRIAWSNPTSTLHHVTFYDSPVDGNLHVPSGGAEVKRFKKKGDYLYRCDISTHSYLLGGECFGMCGRFTVE